jgi:MinD superfamily P-loop ATPase
VRKKLKEIVVISGKGGTGKTSIVGSFAALAGGAVLADCDVDAADLHLLLGPKTRERHEFVGGKGARVIAEKCTGCGKCEEVCNFEAVRREGPANKMVDRTYVIDGMACEGCGVCVEFCPVDAIKFEDAVNGRWFVSETRFGPMVHAELWPGEENSGKLVSVIRKEAKRIAAEQDKELLICDGSPGIGCPVIASITGADFVLAVTEPSVSAQHDLDRVLELAEHFGIPATVCINKFDINKELAESITRSVKARGLRVAGRIAYDEAVTKAQVAAETIVEYGDGETRQQIESLWGSVSGMLASKGSK